MHQSTQHQKVPGNSRLLSIRSLVFIDETGLSTKMARLRGRAPRGERCRAGIPVIQYPKRDPTSNCE